MADERTGLAPLDAPGPEFGRPWQHEYGSPRDAPGPWCTGEEPLDPEGGKPAADPEKALADLLAHGKDGKPAASDTRSLAAGDRNAAGGG